MQCFAARYNSVQLAKVVRGTNGESRGYAFVNFTSEADYKDALTHMQGHRGLGANPLRVSLAIPRNYNMIPGKKKTEKETLSSHRNGFSLVGRDPPVGETIGLLKYVWVVTHQLEKPVFV